MDECEPLNNGASLEISENITLTSNVLVCPPEVGRCRLTLSNPC